jgi:predicted nucleotide-binding protein
MERKADLASSSSVQDDGLLTVDDTAPEFSRRIFVVHGRDGEHRETVARFLEQLELEAVILHEQPNRGRALITKFREVAADIGFAIVLMTPDDIGGIRDGTSPQQPRARQNVIFELGFFIGALGPDRVAALVSGQVERPSDFDGVVYIPLEADWRLPLCRELRAAGYEVDLNKVL